MKNFSEFIQEAPIKTESSRVQWLPTKAKVGEDGKVSNNDIPKIIKTDGPKKQKPEGKGYTECKTCDTTGRIHQHTGRVGRDKETGKIEAQYLEQSCPRCRGRGHYIPEKPKSDADRMRDFLNDPRYPNRGD